jgi:hypothetical protein
MLSDGWPPLRISIRQIDLRAWGIDNIIAALQDSDRVFRVSLWEVANPQLEQISAAMQQPFPALTDLDGHHTYGARTGTGLKLRFAQAWANCR